MAMAGAGRVFELCDEKPEVDEGFVELVNVRYNKNNELIETKEILRCGHGRSRQRTVTVQSTQDLLVM